jgi:hypothetical protein
MLSKHEQEQRGNHFDQQAKLRKAVAKLGGVVVGVTSLQVSGFDPYWLAGPVEIAKRRKAKLVAESTNRFIRHPAYHSKDNPTAQARESDLDDLRWWTQGLELVTIHDPDAEPGGERSEQIKRGQDAKGRKGGRPRKRRRWPKETREQARELRRAGASLGEIARELGVPRPTVQYWLRGA